MLSTQKETELLHFIKENLDKNIDVHKFLYWQKMSNTINPVQIRSDSKWYIMMYYVLLDDLMEWTFNSIEDFAISCGKSDKWASSFKTWLDNSKPKVAEIIEKYIYNKSKIAKQLQKKYIDYKDSKWEYTDDIKAKMEIIPLTINKEVGMVSFKDTLWEILNIEFNSPEVRQLFEEHNKQDVDIYQSYDMMLKAMSKDMMATKQILLQSCMLTIVWYYNSLKERVEKWEKITYIELKNAYDILKIENNEPTRITETRNKNSSISINIPLDPTKVESYMRKAVNQDLKIEVAPNHKKTLKQFTKKNDWDK